MRTSQAHEQGKQESVKTGGDGENGRSVGCLPRWVWQVLMGTVVKDGRATPAGVEPLERGWRLLRFLHPL